MLFSRRSVLAICVLCIGWIPLWVTGSPLHTAFGLDHRLPSYQAAEFTGLVPKRPEVSKGSLEPRTLTVAHPTKGFALEKFHATGMIMPIAVAARYLEDFYDIIALKIETGFWNGMAPLHSLTLTRWNYELTFFCYAAPVAWEFIQEVAIEMSSWAEKGFTAEFDAVYKSVDSLGKEIFISVVMKLVNRDGLDGTIHT